MRPMPRQQPRIRQEPTRHPQHRPLHLQHRTRRRVGRQEVFVARQREAHGAAVEPAAGVVLRDGELGWVATRNFSSGVGQALCTLA